MRRSRTPRSAPPSIRARNPSGCTGWRASSASLYGPIHRVPADGGGPITLEGALALARRKDGADPATLAWVLSTWRVPAGVPLPEGESRASLLAYRDALIERLTTLAMPDPLG